MEPVRRCSALGSRVGLMARVRRASTAAVLLRTPKECVRFSRPRGRRARAIIHVGKVYFATPEFVRRRSQTDQPAPILLSARRRYRRVMRPTTAIRSYVSTPRPNPEMDDIHTISFETDGCWWLGKALAQADDLYKLCDGFGDGLRHWKKP